MRTIVCDSQPDFDHGTRASNRAGSRKSRPAIPRHWVALCVLYLWVGQLTKLVASPVEDLHMAAGVVCACVAAGTRLQSWRSTMNILDVSRQCLGGHWLTSLQFPFSGFCRGEGLKYKSAVLSPGPVRTSSVLHSPLFAQKCPSDSFLLPSPSH